MKPKVKKRRKKVTPLDKIKKELDKLEKLHTKENAILDSSAWFAGLWRLEKLHEKEDAIVERISNIIDEEQEKEEEDYDFDKWEGTDPE